MTERSAMVVAYASAFSLCCVWNLSQNGQGPDFG